MSNIDLCFESESHDLFIKMRNHNLDIVKRPQFICCQISATGRTRKLALAIIRSKIFDSFILLVIFSNCVTMAVEPSH
jgi:hypothetical protein